MPERVPLTGPPNFLKLGFSPKPLGPQRGSLCSVAATASRVPVQLPSIGSSTFTTRTDSTFLKDGLRVLPQRVLPGKPKASPLTSPGSESGVSGLSHDARDTAPLLDNLETSPISPLHAPLSPPSNPTALQTASECSAPEGTASHEPSQVADSESESAASGYETDTEVEDDIDAAVAEYQEKLRVATLDTGAPSTPNPASARRACLILAVLLLNIIVESFVAVYGWRGGGTHPFLVATLAVCMLVTLLLVVLLLACPSSVPSQTSPSECRPRRISWYFYTGCATAPLPHRKVVTQEFGANEFICLGAPRPPCPDLHPSAGVLREAARPAHHHSFTGF
ncbi:uncharacterized protein LOC119571237 [Penaeus monodon]|uniref:uncharacterized protein LOC119571237 n=1 Tax=Penaeus monodon TaxID=6687 RepID=UPI0018A738E9|nr:uncharacterized protein LOC119571237 [Penaeus monodon]